MPTGTWNGDLVIFAHGYVDVTRPVEIPENQLELPGFSIPEIINALDFAFATTSYSVNGLAVIPGMADLIDLVDIFEAAKGVPGHVYLVGASEGGIITTLLIEQYPDVYDGGLAICGPVGDFAGQINYLGDFRVIFDYFFPGLMPGNPVDIPQTLIDGWDMHYDTMIKPAILDPVNAELVDQLLAVTSAPFDAGDPTTKEASIHDLLWYNVFATNDGIAKLGGQPYFNQARDYTGSDDDVLLNSQVGRFTADQAALNEIEANYQTTGVITAPLVMVHTTGDQIVPFWHALQYRGKIILNDQLALHRHNVVERYGHCQFEPAEVLSAFGELVALVDNPPMPIESPRFYLPLSFTSSQD
jgi:pimeloyl-ACP methyl ester carboxylesterase